MLSWCLKSVKFCCNTCIFTCALYINYLGNFKFHSKFFNCNPLISALLGGSFKSKITVFVEFFHVIVLCARSYIPTNQIQFPSRYIYLGKCSMICVSEKLSDESVWKWAILYYVLRTISLNFGMPYERVFFSIGTCKVS